MVHGDRDPLDPQTFAEDPGGSVTESPWEQLRDDNRVKAKREKLVANR